jgi:hypothetical protein
MTGRDRGRPTEPPATVPARAAAVDVALNVGDVAITVEDVALVEVKPCDPPQALRHTHPSTTVSAWHHIARIG